MSKTLTPAEQARYAELAARAETGDFSPIDADARAADSGTEVELDELLDELDDHEVDQFAPIPSAPPETEVVSAEDVRSVLGRPSLDGTVGTGVSPKRQVRLPADLNALLDQRAEAEHRTASDILRDALERYLRAS